MAQEPLKTAFLAIFRAFPKQVIWAHFRPYWGYCALAQNRPFHMPKSRHQKGSIWGTKQAIIAPCAWLTSRSEIPATFGPGTGQD